MDDCCSAKQNELIQLQGPMRGVLVIVMVLNAIMFVLEFGVGLYSRSSALTADSLDMLGDAIVYGVSLYAMAKSIRWRASVALFKGGLIAVLAMAAVVQLVRHLMGGPTPMAPLMMLMGSIALAVNVACLVMLYRYRQHDVNMSSTFECSRNDVISNGGVLIAAGGVYLLENSWPDILAGGIIAAILIRSSVRIARQAWMELEHAP